MRFLKGHGTQNDFILLPDHTEPLTPALVQQLCHRRSGIGADGVIRVAYSEDARALYFMDYWNADGTTAEMCGNGARVFARYLVAAGLEKPGVFCIDTRAGVLEVEAQTAGNVSVSMPVAEIGETTHAEVGGRTLTGIAVRAPNPHCVCITTTLVDEFDLSEPPTLDADVFPDGANMEIVNILAPHTARMRVYERGSRETHSCGTGVVAVAATVRHQLGLPESELIQISVPGGVLNVWGEEGVTTLNGPAVFVAEGVTPAALNSSDTIESRE